MAAAHEPDHLTAVALLWEDIYLRPALGDPVFESQPPAVWIKHICAKAIRRGGGADVVDGQLRLTAQPSARRARDHGLTGDPVWDAEVRRSVLGGVDADDDDG